MEGGGGGGRALRYRMATHCQMAAVKGIHLRAVNSFVSKRGGQSTSNYEPNKGSNL